MSLSARSEWRKDIARDFGLGHSEDVLKVSDCLDPRVNSCRQKPLRFPSARINTRNVARHINCRSEVPSFKEQTDHRDQQRSLRSDVPESDRENDSNDGDQCLISGSDLHFIPDHRNQVEINAPEWCFNWRGGWERYRSARSNEQTVFITVIPDSTSFLIILHHYTLSDRGNEWNGKWAPHRNIGRATLHFHNARWKRRRISAPRFALARGRWCFKWERESRDMSRRAICIHLFLCIPSNISNSPCRKIERSRGGKISRPYHTRRSPGSWV